MKLIVEEAGNRRAFKVGSGVLTVGSGAEARLRLSSTDLAEIHFEIEVREGGLLVRPRPGVLPVRVQGVPVSDEREIGLGVPVTVGGAKLWLESEEGRAAVHVPPPGTPSRSLVRRTPRRVQKGPPGWMIGGGVVVGLAIAVLVLQALLSKSATHEAGGLQGTIAAARAALQKSQLDVAEAKVVQAMEEASGKERDELLALRKKIEESRARNQVAVENNIGTRWMHTYLENYEERYLEGKEPEPHIVRLFVKRLNEFKSRWPQHPKLDWVERQLKRLQGSVDLSAAPTWEDVEWEVRLMVAGKPRNYVEAFSILEGMRGKLGATDELALEARLLELSGERAEYHKDRLYQAQYEFEKNKDAPKAVWWLVHGVIWIGEDYMADEAAKYLVRMPDLAAHLRGYEEKYPDRLDLLMENEVVARWARETGFER